LDESNADLTRLTGDLEEANVELDTAEGVQTAIVDFISVSLTLGGGISEGQGRCVAETMDADIGTEQLLRSSLAAAGLTPNSQEGGLFTTALTGAAATCGVPLGSGSAAPAVAGSPLPAFSRDGADNAIGVVAPTVTGVDLNGATIQIGGTGRPTAVVFLAHWCPHCQREVPQVQGWIDATGGVSGVDIVSVASSTDSTRDNYPPSDWLQREGWTQPVLADDPRNTAMAAFGGTAFPFWVFLNADGTVEARVAGSTDITTLEGLLQSIAR
ncbi:MAG: TlpA family protein disulfide reductase, partial [Acidimicrobiia bacterium]|nr:TlpA family protein disulfide reductase [Acidimicrobiia bacterium]